MKCPICGEQMEKIDVGCQCPVCHLIFDVMSLPLKPNFTVSISGLEKIEPLTGIIIESRWSPPSTSELTAKLNEVIERQNRIIDYLNEMVKK